jgi:hypothetical protein
MIEPQRCHDGTSRIKSVMMEPAEWEYGVLEHIEGVVVMMWKLAGR